MSRRLPSARRPARSSRSAERRGRSRRPAFKRIGRTATGLPPTSSEPASRSRQRLPRLAADSVATPSAAAGETTWIRPPDPSTTTRSSSTLPVSRAVTRTRPSPADSPRPRSDPSPEPGHPGRARGQRLRDREREESARRSGPPGAADRRPPARRVPARGRRLLPGEEEVRPPSFRQQRHAVPGARTEGAGRHCRDEEGERAPLDPAGLPEAPGPSSAPPGEPARPCTSRSSLPAATARSG